MKATVAMGTQGHEAEAWEAIVAKSAHIGHGVYIRLTGLRGSEIPGGLLLYHRHRDGAVCGGAVPFDVPGADTSRPRWTVQSWYPLTLSPSIADHTCSEGLHGHIVNTAWIPC